jgi:hypothetical protein
MKSLSVKELLETAGLAADGSMKWCEKITAAKRGGIYVVTIADPISAKLKLVRSSLLSRWNDGQAIIYIGRSVNLRRRLREFLRHR